jgi:spoIIIJ-associated protein
MEWVETTGRTVAEAKDAALDQLGVDDADAEFVVVNEPRAGLFGRMRGEARVRARVRPTSPRPKRGRSRRPAQEQRRDGSGRGGGGRSTPGSATVTSSPPAEADRVLVDGAPSRNGSAGQGSSHRGRRRGSRGRTSAGEAGRPQARSSSSDKAAPQKERTPRGDDRPGRPGSIKEASMGEVLSLEEQGESAREFIEGLIEEIGLEATVSLRVVDSETVEVVVEGQELGLLVGRGGATLGALQELARTVVQSRTAGPTDRILVDVAGYRAKRSEALQRFTQQVAEEVLSSGTEQALEPMLAPDRKVVHDAVSEIDGVETRSEGEEPRRYVVVAPQGTPTDPTSDDD